MKKILSLLTIFLLALILVGCTEEPQEDISDPVRNLHIYYLNDLHGALLEGDREMGISKIGNFLIDEKTSMPDNTLILGGGDMVQGTLISNATFGQSTTHLMDVLGFDATVIGNHEFDWGLDMVTRYYNDSSDVYQAEHKMLGANVFYEGTTDIPSGLEPYTIIERGGHRIGIIGTIGEGLESSILATMVEDYTFADPVPIIADYAEYLRTEKDVNIVIVISHDSGNNLNPGLAALEDNQNIDAVFNGHSHQTNTDTLNGMPAMISGSNGSHIGHMRLVIEEAQVIDHEMRNITDFHDHRLKEPHPEVEAVLESYLLEVEHLYAPIFPAAEAISSNDLTYWMSELMMRATGADIGVQNSGGTRDYFIKDEDVSIARLYDVFPFDNTVVTADVKGDVLLNLLQYNSNYYTELDTIDPDETYRLATNNYIFHRDGNNLETSDNIVFHDFQMFYLAVEELLNQAKMYDDFSIDRAILLDYYETWYDEDYDLLD